MVNYLDACIAHPCKTARTKGHGFCKPHLKAYLKPGHYRIPKTNKEVGR